MATIGHLSTWKTWRKNAERFSEICKRNINLTAVAILQYLRESGYMTTISCGTVTAGSASMGENQRAENP